MANVGKFHATSKPREDAVQLLRGFFQERDGWRAWLRHLPPSANSVGHHDGVDDDDDDGDDDNGDNDDDGDGEGGETGAAKHI